MHFEKSTKINKILTENFSPIILKIINESNNHHVPPNSETHFKIILVTDFFENLSRIQRHKKIYSLLDKEMKTGIHALALHLFTQKEWQKNSGIYHDSPICQGQSKF